MIVNILIIFLGVLWFFFNYWRRLKDDYISSQIFASGIYIIGFTLLFYFTVKKYLPAYWYWGGFGGFILGVIVSSKRIRLRYFETFESAIVSVLPFLAAIYLMDTVKNSSLFSLGGFIITFGFLLIYRILNDRYKNIGWYKSGRIGFAGLTTLGIYFIFRGIVALVFPFMLSFSGNYETILSGVVSFFLFLMVFNLSKKIV